MSSSSSFFLPFVTDGSPPPNNRHTDGLTQTHVGSVCAQPKRTNCRERSISCDLFPSFSFSGESAAVWCGILLLGILLLTSKKLVEGEMGGEGWREEGGRRWGWTWFFLPEGEKREVRKVAVLVLLLLLLFPQASIHAQSFLLSWL